MPSAAPLAGISTVP